MVGLGVGSLIVVGLLKAFGRVGRSPSHRRMLRLIGRAPLRAAPVLNRPERKLHRQLSGIVRASRTHTLLAQVSMGEFLRVDGKPHAASDRQRVFNAFNAKRVDFLIVDADWQPCIVIEYHGAGHFQGNARTRDAIKRAVCARSGIVFMEVAKSGLTDEQINDLAGVLYGMGTVAAE